MPRGDSPTRRLAEWFWFEILEKPESPFAGKKMNPAFPRYLSESKRCLKKLDLDVDILKECLLQMKRTGKYQMSSMLLPTLIAHHFDGPCWYDFVKEELETPPPVYNAHAFRAWCKRTGNMHLLEHL